MFYLLQDGYVYIYIHTHIAKILCRFDTRTPIPWFVWPFTLVRVKEGLQVAGWAEAAGKADAKSANHQQEALKQLQNSE